MTGTLNQVATELKKYENQETKTDRFPSVMTTFYKEAKKSCDEYEVRLKKCDADFATLKTFYGVKDDKMMWEVFFRTFADFAQSFEEAETKIVEKREKLAQELKRKVAKDEAAKKGASKGPSIATKPPLAPQDAKAAMKNLMAEAKDKKQAQELAKAKEVIKQTQEEQKEAEPQDGSGPAEGGEDQEEPPADRLSDKIYKSLRRGDAQQIKKEIANRRMRGSQDLSGDGSLPDHNRHVDKSLRGFDMKKKKGTLKALQESKE
jgi:hypothetical protein